MYTRRTITLVPWAILAFSFLNYQTVRASNYWYVSPTGNNSADCLSSSTPCRTIQAVIDKAVSGDYILAAAGTYSGLSNAESFPININKSLSISGSGADVTIIDAAGSGHNIFQAAGCGLNIALGNFTIQGGIRGIEFIGDYGTCITGLINNNRITSNSTGIYIANTNNLNIRRNDISTNSMYGIHSYYSIGLIYWNSMGWNGSGSIYAAIFNDHANPTIYNNIVGWNNGSGIYNSYSSPNVVNNTIAFNYGGSGVANFNSSNSVLTNNIIIANGVYGILEDNTSIPIKTYNDVWANAWSDYYGTGGGIGSISRDPRFVSLFDAHLLCSSPAINAGNNSAPGVPSVDYDNNPRPVGSVVDMGAYEKQSDLFCPVLLPFISR